MSLYVIADLHLSLSAKNKSMEVFGRRWKDYITKLKKNFEAIVEPEDTVVIPGDISWALSLEEAREDFRFLASLPGQKILGKGNHDFWWSTMQKNMQFLTDNQFSGIRFFQNNAFLCEDFVLAGTRGWFADPCGENIPEETDYEKLTAREAGRLRLSLEAAKTLTADAGRNNLETLVFLHFPPVWNGCICRPITDILAEYQIRRVFFGHIHGNYTVPSSFSADGIRYALISADFLNFCPRPVLPELFFG